MGAFRCFGEGDALYERYHDEEWGRPTVDENELFERLTLEGFQSGLSWITILRKREGFRRAFDGFDPEPVAAMDERDVERLLAEPEIVRNRAKIEATIGNARALVELHERGESLGGIVWESAQRSPKGQKSLSDLPAFTEEAKTLSKKLKKLGFRFVGPTTAYSTMQAVGVVNDHLSDCHVRNEVERERRSFLEALPKRSRAGTR